MNTSDLGQLLRTTRQERGKKLKTAATALEVREEYLQMLEEGDLVGLEKRNVFVFGYLKAYLDWLALDSTAILKSLKEDTETHTIVKANRFRPTASHIYLDQEALRPGLKLILITLILLAAAYGLWYVTLAPTPPSLTQAITEPAVIKEEPKRMILLAREAALVTLLDRNGDPVLERSLNAGDTVFLEVKPLMSIRSDKPQVLDVFLDDVQNTFLGSLDEVMPSSVPFEPIAPVTPPSAKPLEESSATPEPTTAIQTGAAATHEEEAEGATQEPSSLDDANQPIAPIPAAEMPTETESIPTDGAL